MVRVRGPARAAERPIGGQLRRPGDWGGGDAHIECAGCGRVRRLSRGRKRRSQHEPAHSTARSGRGRAGGARRGGGAGCRDGVSRSAEVGGAG